jgi:simple sugar transport system permease protein
MSALLTAPRRALLVEPRQRPSVTVRILVPIGSILLAALFGAVILVADGHSPLLAYREVLASGFGGQLPLVRTLMLATPLILTALAAAIAFKMKVWNIGADGQLMMGAIAASGTAIAMAGTPGPLLVPAILVAGIVGGALWAGIAAVLRTYFNTDEVISTLMLTFIASHFMEYLIFGSFSFWRDPTVLNYPTGLAIADAGKLPRIWGRLHLGFVIAVVLALLIWWLMKSTRWGYEIRVIGDSQTAARYAGMRVARNVIAVLLVSGALAGLAGAIEVSGVNYALQPTALQTGVGFTGIVVAAMARLHPLMVVPVAVLLAGLISSGTSLQQMGVPIDIVLLLQGLVLLGVAAGEFLLTNKLQLGFMARREWGRRSE